MDKIDRFERILGLVERVRNLDLVTARVINSINQQQISLYRELTKDPSASQTPIETDLQTEHSNTKREKGMTQENTGKPIPSAEDVMAFLSKTMDEMKRIRETPPDSPLPPSGADPSKELDQLNRIKQMSTAVAEHLRVQIDVHKYAAAAIAETHKMSFDLYKEIDNYMKRS